MLDKLIFLVALAGTAVVFADVLVRDGMLLAPVQRWVREWYRRPFRPIAYTADPEQPHLGPIRCLGPEISKEIDAQWWWKPLWGCSLCVAGQWGFWGYLIYTGRHLASGPPVHPEIFRAWAAHFFGWLTRYWLAYSLPEHIAFAAFTIIAAIILQKWTRDN